MELFTKSIYYLITILATLTIFAESISISNTVLIISPDSANAATVTGTLQGYGIPYEIALVPQAGASLPQLNQTNGNGNYGLFVVISLVSYNYGDAWRSALNTSQWNSLYDYQVMYGIRMVHLNVYPTAQFGATPLGGCCDATLSQTVQVDQTVAAAQFPGAGVKFPVLNMTGLWHFPATITDTNSTVSFMTFGSNSQFPSSSSGGVINSFPNGRQQMAFFTSFGTWSAVSNYMNHIWINWGLFGLFAGYRRVLLSTQIDDLFLPSLIYNTTGTFRLRPADVSAHLDWQKDLNSRLVSGGNTGSNYTIEFGFNGNGNFLYTQTLGIPKVCAAPINYIADQPVTALEFQKILGTGIDLWPLNSTFDWTKSCMQKDPLVAMFMEKPYRDSFALVSHTFTHEGENAITYSDSDKEISFNKQYAKISGLDQGAIYSSKGLIPPAITGLHNGDALRAWHDNGLTSCVGDNTRPILMSPYNNHWPLITNSSTNGYDGFMIIPRFSSRIYFNCDTANCTLLEWINTSAGKGDINTLLNLERESTAKNLLALMHDPYMFHQANLRNADVDMMTINGNYKRYSLLQMWTESILNEFTQYVNWPIITKKHDDIATDFMNRMTRDQCKYTLTWDTSKDQTQITGFTVGATDNTCSAAIPITLPQSNSIANVGSYATEKIGNDPITLWVKLTGSMQSFTLTTPIKLTAAGGAGSQISSSSLSVSAASSTTGTSSSQVSGMGSSSTLSTGMTSSSSASAIMSSGSSSSSSTETSYIGITNSAVSSSVSIGSSSAKAKVKRHEAHRRHHRGHN